MEYMFPMNFEEFLMALNENQLIQKIKTSFFDLTPLSEVLHEKAIHLYKQYLCIGGMPEAVINFIELIEKKVNLIT